MAHDALIASWHRAENVLTAPITEGVTPARRKELVREFRRMSRQLVVIGRTRPNDTMPEVTPEATREHAFATARRRGLLLLDRFPTTKTMPVPGFPLHLTLPGDRSESPEFRFNHFAYHADARQSLAEACSQCGELLAAAVGRAEKSDDPVAAERWLRIVPAYAAVSDAPLDSHRRNRVKSILATQARRTYLDHWYGEGGTRYYATAIERLAQDAGNLKVSGVGEVFDPYRKPESDFPIEDKTPKRFVVTDELNPELKVPFQRLEPEKLAGVPVDAIAGLPAETISGVPVFWSSPLVQFDSRLPESLDPKESLTTLARPIARLTTPVPRFPTSEGSPVQIEGFFRGRTIVKPVAIEIYRQPDRVASTSPPLASTAIAVRADPRLLDRLGYGSGAVAIVLDCTGSVGPPDRKNPFDNRPYDKELNALAILLEKLPPGTLLNVWVFGQRMPESKSPESTIREVLPLTEIPDDRSGLIKLITDDVSALEPWDLSPIVRAALMARDQIKDLHVPFKSVVLISDGVDTRYDHDPMNPKKRSVKDAIRAEFPPTGVSLSLLAVEAPPNEAVYQADFAIINELKPAGKFVPIDRIDELIAWLRSGLNPRVRFTLELSLHQPRPVPGIGDLNPRKRITLEPRSGQFSPVELTAGAANSDNWYTGRLEPGTYEFQVRGAKNFIRNVRLERGDRLLLDLTENDGAIELKRHWFADTAPGAKSGTPSDPWRLNLLQNRSEAGGSQAVPHYRRPTTPHEPCFRYADWRRVVGIAPVLPNPKPVAVRWRPALGFPAPSWSIDVPGWPEFPGSTAAASPVLEAWWSPGEKFQAQGDWFAPLNKSIRSLQGETQTFRDTSVTLTTVDLEEHVVDGKPRKCLVVRLTNPPGNPVWVRPRGAVLAGSEVRVYRGASAVTCLFWGIDIDAVTGFDVVVLNDALKRAESQGCHALFDTIPGPTDTSLRPEPPVEPR